MKGLTAERSTMKGLTAERSTMKGLTAERSTRAYNYGMGRENNRNCEPRETMKWETHWCNWQFIST